MTINEEMKIPYVSKELCTYLRQLYTIPTLLTDAGRMANSELAMGMIYGVNRVIERLEAIQAQQEENDGIY